MTAPMLAKATDYGRMYARTRGGDVKVPSITTVLDVLDSEMGWWDALCAAREAAENAPLIAETISSLPEGKVRNRAIRDFVDIHKDAAERDRNAAAERGDFVHNYGETYALHLMGRVPHSEVIRHLELCREQGLMAYVDSFHAFWNKFEPKPKLPEATVWNSTIGYAGTTDLWCVINGIDVTLDWKTKKKVLEYRPHWDPEPALTKRNALNSKVGMQLAAAISSGDNLMGSDHKAWQWGKLHQYLWRNSNGQTVRGPIRILIRVDIQPRLPRPLRTRSSRLASSLLPIHR